MKKLLALCMCAMMALGALASCDSDKKSAAAQNVTGDMNSFINQAGDQFEEIGLCFENLRTDSTTGWHQQGTGTTLYNFPLQDTEDLLAPGEAPVLYLYVDNATGQVVSIKVAGGKKDMSAQVFRAVLSSIGGGDDGEQILAEIQDQPQKEVQNSGLCYQYANTAGYQRYIVKIPNLDLSF